MSCRVRLGIFLNSQLLLSVILACFSIIASAKQSGYRISTPVDSAEVRFDQIIDQKNTAIVNGPEYHTSFTGRKTNPFYQSTESNRSFVRYDNDLYKNLDLLYDIYEDILILKCSTPSGTYYIKLDKNLVQEFNLHHHHFKKFDNATTTKNSIYFDVLFEESQFAILVRRTKVQRIEKGISDYLEDDNAYILNQGKWIRVTGKGSFKKTIKKDLRKDLMTFIKNNHIKLRKQKDEDLTKLGAFCYSLKERE